MINFRLINTKSKNPCSNLFRSAGFYLYSQESLNKLIFENNISKWFNLTSEEEALGTDNNMKCIINNYPMVSERGLLNIKPNVSDYLSYYKNILEVNSLLIKQILINLSQISYGENCCISCFAGKDRTGVLSYIVQKILNYDEDEIKKSYVQSGKELSENILLFKESAYKKNLSLNEYAERFTFGELIFHDFDNYFANKYGNIEYYLETLGVNRVYINQIIKIFGDKNDL